MHIVLVGDSIRIGYEPYIRRELAGLADLWTPGENGGNSRNVLDHLDEWVLAQRPNLLHINCGLHDVRRDNGAPQPAISLTDYEANLRTLFARLREAGIATLWATSTPINEVRHARSGPSQRREEDVIAYNRVSIRVAQEFGLPVNDLYSLINRLGRDRYLKQDGRHYVPAGYALLGHAVADAIRPYLG